MSVKGTESLRETDLYQPVRELLEAQGYTVRSEVKGCDITASRGEDLVVVELKREFGTSLLAQAARRQRITPSVYVALPKPANWRRSERWRGNLLLLRRLEIGLIWVDPKSDPPTVEVEFHPTPYERQRSSKSRTAVVREMTGRSGEYNVGGSTRRKIATAYREKVTFIACCLERHGPLSPKQIRQMGADGATLSILRSNFYGWFERLERGVYALKPWVPQALEEFPELAARLRKKVPPAAP